MNTADLSDAYPDVQICEPLFRNFGRTISFHGPVRTVKCFEDNTCIRQALSQKVDGAVLVVDAGGSRRCAMLGDNLARMGLDNGWTGAVFNGLIRDSAEIGTMPFGVKALGTIPKRSQKEGVGKVDVPVSFAGVTFEPGDYLYADEDGIIVSSEPLALPD
ncbi:MAG: ribonuclease E activity regulator RraA [Gammaproteobacteria bacterium]|nr:ribonuclease E activity regulator RraA [Gammaproteobacteria bacterium]